MYGRNLLDTGRFNGRNLKKLPMDLVNTWILYSMVYEIQHETIHLYGSASAIITFKDMHSKFNLQPQQFFCSVLWILSLRMSWINEMTVGSKMDAYLQKDIDKLEKVRRQAARFISGGYTSRDHGCVTQLLTDSLHLPPFQDRRKANRSSSRWSRGWCRHCRPMTI